MVEGGRTEGMFTDLRSHVAMVAVALATGCALVLGTIIMATIIIILFILNHSVLC